MREVKIVRMKDGFDVVAIIERLNNGNWVFVSPMMIDVEDGGKQMNLRMEHWLPTAIVKENRVVIKQDDILTTFEPSDNFCEYFLTTVDKYNQIKLANESIDKMSDEEMELVVNALDEIGSNKNLVIH